MVLLYIVMLLARLIMICLPFFLQGWIVKAYFQRWIRGVKVSRQETENMMQLADSSYERTLSSNCLKQWKEVSITIVYKFHIYVLKATFRALILQHK